MVKNKKTLLVVFLLTIVLGLILVIETVDFLETINYVLVSIFAIIGVLEIIGYIFSKGYKEQEYFGLIMGVVFLWLAILFYLYYTTIILFLPIALSLYAFIIGTITLIKFIQDKNLLYVITSILSFIMGIMLMFMPWFTLSIYIKIAGVYMVYTSIVYLLELRKVTKK